MPRKTELAGVLGTLAFTVSVLCGGCGDVLDGGNATLRDYTGLDGCGWVIETDAGGVLEPLNLGEFIADPDPGMRLAIDYQEEGGYASICMVGPIVTLLACDQID